MADYPQVKFRYKVEIDGLDAGGFSEVSGLDLSIDPIEYREGNATAETPMKVQGLKKYSNITLKQGLTSGKVLYDWIATGINGVIERKTITVSVLDTAQSPVASWQLINAWPTKYTAPDLNATSNEVAIESMELCHEGLTRVS